MKKAIVLIFALCCCLDSSAVCPEQIKEFYSAYICNFLHRDGYAKNMELCKAHMTKSLIRKLQRTTQETGADAVIRAQDVNEYAVESLSVLSLGNEWFMVTYFWNGEVEKPVARIHLKAVDSGNTFKIIDIADDI